MKLKKIHLFFIILLSFSLLSFFKYFLGYTIETMTTQTRKINDSTFTKTSDENNKKTITTSDGRVVHATTDNTVNGINYNNIPAGQEDLYILKSQVVPPVCPACPTLVNNCDKNNKCSPCPPCGRCPEPSFECVKRPTYQADNPYLPMPVLADFSQFGM